MQLRRQRGFTLIELMIVVVIAGILAAIAIPSYQKYVIKGNRAAAQSFMLSVAQKEEQYLLDGRQYLDIATPSSFSSLGLSVPTEVSKFYTVTVAYVGSSTRTYNIQAVPISSTMQKDDGTLTLDNAGTKGPSDKW